MHGSQTLGDRSQAQGLGPFPHVSGFFPLVPGPGSQVPGPGSRAYSLASGLFPGLGPEWPLVPTALRPRPLPGVSGLFQGGPRGPGGAQGPIWDHFGNFRKWDPPGPREKGDPYPKYENLKLFLEAETHATRSAPKFRAESNLQCVKPRQEGQVVSQNHVFQDPVPGRPRGS